VRRRRDPVRQDDRVRISWGQALAWRLERNFLLDPCPGDAVDVVRRLCGVQAQVPGSARLAVAVRRPPAGTARPTPASNHGGASPQDGGDAMGQQVASALAEHRLVRTWAMRGTLHLLPADALADHLALLAAARTWHRGSWQRTFADAATMARLAEAVPAALDGPPLTVRMRLCPAPIVLTHPLTDFGS
jgi:Winged helix DNA-binding domain